MLLVTGFVVNSGIIGVPPSSSQDGGTESKDKILLVSCKSNMMRPDKIQTSDFQMQAHVFTEKASYQGLFWKEKFVHCCIFGGLLSSSQSRQS